MGVFHDRDLRCGSCGSTFQASLADTINVTRFPETKQLVLDGRLHRTHCPHCGLKQTIEVAFQYLDFDNHFYAQVYPRKERHFHRRASANLRSASAITARVSSPINRVVFGLGELREKVIARDNGIDDRLLEFLKLYLIKEHPFIIQERRLRIYLDAVSSQKASFRVGFDHKPDAFQMHLPARVLSEGALRLKEFRDLSTDHHKDESLFEDQTSSWVNLWRWSPRTNALDELSHFAETVRQGEQVTLTGDRFQFMLEDLPRGNQLPGWAKKDLSDLERYADRKNATKIQDQLFEVRFGIELDDDWVAANEFNGVATIWELLRSLPDLNVEGNSWLHRISQSETPSQSYYNSETREIHLSSGLVAGTDEFEATLLHEVAHATQAMLDAQQDEVVAKWLTERFGWLSFEPDDIDDWVSLLGGYGLDDETEIAEIRQIILSALGNGTMNRPPFPQGPIGSIWNEKDYKLRNVLLESRSRWWRSFPKWERHNGRAFFLNHHYGTFMAVDEAALDLITAHSIDHYAAMSPFEYFAELYATRFDPDQIAAPNLPNDILEWFDTHIGLPDDLQESLV